MHQPSVGSWSIGDLAGRLLPYDGSRRMPNRYTMLTQSKISPVQTRSSGLPLHKWISIV